MARMQGLESRLKAVLQTFMCLSVCLGSLILGGWLAMGCGQSAQVQVRSVVDAFRAVIAQVALAWIQLGLCCLTWLLSPGLSSTLCFQLCLFRPGYADLVHGVLVCQLAIRSAM